MRSPQLHLGLLAPALFLGLFFGWPLARTLEAAFAPTALDAWQWLQTDYASSRIQVAVKQAVYSTVATLALAVPLAWHHHVRRVPFSRVQLALHAAPFVLPVFVVVFGIRETLGAGGLVHGATGIDLIAWGGPMLAVVAAHAFYNYGMAARLMHTTLKRRPHRLEVAARLLGATPGRAFLRASLPPLLPGLLSVVLLVFLFTFTSFGVVLFLGGTTVATLETMLYDQLQGIRRDIDRAAVLGVLQLTVNVALLIGYLALRGRDRLPFTASRGERSGPVGTTLSIVALGAALVVPASVLAGAFRVGDRWSLEPWRALLDKGHPQHLPGFDLLHALDVTLWYAVWSTLLSISLALLLGYGLQRLGRWPRRLAEGAAALPLGTSSLLIGFGYVLAFGAGALLDLRGSLLLVVLAHTLVAFPFTARALLPALDQHDRRLDEAAGLLGAPPLHVVGRIHWPLLRGPLLVAAGFAVAMSLGDFGASLLLTNRETASIAVWIGLHDVPFRTMIKAQSLALSAILMILAAASFVLVERFGKEAEL